MQDNTTEPQLMLEIPEGVLWLIIVISIVVITFTTIL